MSSTLDRAQREGVTSYVSSAAVALLRRDTTPFTPHGTGTLFRIEGGWFLVTAAHVLLEDSSDRDSAYRLACLRTNNRLEFTNILGEYVFSLHSRGYPDVGVIRLSEECIRGLRGRRPLCVGTPPAGGIRIDHDNRFIVCGYPAIQASADDLRSLTTPFIFETRLFGGDAPSQYDPRTDLMLENVSRGFAEQNGLVAGPHILRGLSGCSVWMVRDAGSGEGIWSPERSLELVSIQSSIQDPGDIWNSAWIRTVSWGCIARLIAERYEDVREAIVERYGKCEQT